VGGERLATGELTRLSGLPDPVYPLDNPGMATPTSPTSPGRLRRAVDHLLDLTAQNVEGAVYGTVMIGVLFAVEDARRETYAETVEAALIILLLYVLTHLYAHFLGERLRAREPLTAKLLWHSCLHELPILQGAIVPVFALLVAWILGATSTEGTTAALWTTAVTIVTLEVLAGWRARLGARELLLQAGTGAIFGLTIVGLKLVLH
jgi:hypothetical protein